MPAVPALDDATLFAVVAAGCALVVAAHLWLAARAAGVRWPWGAGSLVVPPVGLVFAGFHARRAALPLAVTAAGWLLVGGGYTASALRPVQTTAVVESGPDLRLTLTGAVRAEYAKLAASRDYAVVQWANADVTDADLELLRGQTRLRELDLSGTQVTDVGLAVLAECRELRVLRLAGTKVTAAGFRDHLTGRPELMDLDLRRTAVPKADARAWQAAKPGRKLAV